MSYLQACIAEGLRLYPPLFSQLREHVVPPEGVVLQGYDIPGGTFVGINMFAGHLNPIYGDRLEEFHPERWLIDDESRLRQMHRDVELVFGYGSSKCLGISFAYLEMNKFVFVVLLLIIRKDLPPLPPEIPRTACSCEANMAPP